MDVVTVVIFEWQERDYVSYKSGFIILGKGVNHTHIFFTVTRCHVEEYISL